jgi:hypothetical protein
MMGENRSPLVESPASQSGTGTDTPGRRGWIFIPPSWPVRLVLAVLSGLSVQPLSILFDLFNLSDTALVTGGLFGVLVLAPFVIEARSVRLLRAFGLVAAAALSHFGAVLLAMVLAASLSRTVTCALAGLAGALLCSALTVLLAPLRRRWQSVALACLGGLAGGVVFGVTPNAYWWTTFDYTVWQLQVFLGLSFGDARAWLAPARPPAA